MRFLTLASVSLLLPLAASPALAAPQAAPRIFYSDLTSGPNSGGVNNAGAFVTVYGARFGSSRGSSSVSVNGNPVASYPVWSNTKVTFQLGAAASTGMITITTPAGTSNGVPFGVRAGNLFFVSNSGSDSKNGSFKSPWRTITKAKTSMKRGDITYVMDGVSQTSLDDWNSSFLLRPDWCSSDLPRALVAFPGATATLGSTTGLPYGLRVVGADSNGQGSCQGGWVFAGLRILGQAEAVLLEGPSSNWRFVGNEISCPNGDGPSGCFAGIQSSGIQFYGNNVHDTGASNASALYHGVYFSTDSNHLDIGWNTIANVHGCRGLQIHSSPQFPKSGYNQYDISIHDNLIHDTQCDAILLATVDPSKGKVEVFNNVIYNAGKGPANPEGTGNWAGVYVAAITNAGSPGGGVVEIYNNTFYSCGTFPPPWNNANGAVVMAGTNPALQVRLRNNIISQPAGVPYLAYPGANLSGASNLFFGNGSPPSGPNFTGSIGKDALFSGAGNFHVLSKSPARQVGVDTGLVTDKDGILRGGAAGIDIGAYQYTASLISLFCTPPVIATPGSTRCLVGLPGLSDTATEVALTADPGVTVAPSVVIPAGGLSAPVDVQAPAAPNTAEAQLTATLQDSSAGYSLWLAMPDDPALLAAVDSASYRSTPVAPGGMVTLFGYNLGPATPASLVLEGNGVATTLAGTTVLFDGVPAPLVYVSKNQVSAVAPFRLTTAAARTRLEVQVNGRTSNPLWLQVEPAAPSIFTLDSSGTGAAAAFNADGTINSPGHPAPKSSGIAFYVSGLGVLDPPLQDGEMQGAGLSGSTVDVAVFIGGVPSQVLYAGSAPGIVAGVYQVNAVIPDSVPSGSSASLVLLAGSAASQADVSVSIQ